jgi:excisionase family DNA binding protein
VVSFLWFLWINQLHKLYLVSVDLARKICSKLTSYLNNRIIRKNKGSKPLEEEEFLTLAEIAKRLKIKEFTVRDWVRKGQLPGYKFGKTYRVKKKDYEEWEKKRRMTGQN